MIDVVFDTVVFVRCLINPHGFWGRLVFAYADRYRLYFSDEILAEILEVLRRPELTRKFKALSQMDTLAVIAVLSEASVIQPVPIPPTCRDPKDDKFLALAAAVNAQYLVTADDDLLSLGSFRGTKIVGAEELLEALEG